MSSFSNIQSTRGKSSWSKLSDDEDWTKLTDINARRRIQNRIAQRNRRKNLKKQREESALQSGSGSDSSPPPQSRSRQSTLTTSKSPEMHNTAEFVFETPYLRSSASTRTPDSSNALNVFQDFSSPAKDPRFHEFLSGKTKAFQPPTPPTAQHNFAASNQDYLYQYLMSGFDDNSLGPFQPAGFLPITPPLLNDESSQFTNYMGDCDKMYHETAPLLGGLDQSPDMNDFCFSDSPFSSTLTPPLSLSLASSPDLTNSSSSTSPDLAQGATTDSPLHLASQKGHLEIVQVLLDTSFAPVINSLSSSGHTPLHLASLAGHTPTASLLLSRGANASLLNNCGQTPLHLAAAGGHADVVALLLEHMRSHGENSGMGVDGMGMGVGIEGGEAYARDFLGQTPFQAAVEAGHVAVVRAMLGSARTGDGPERRHRKTI